MTTTLIRIPNDLHRALKLSSASKGVSMVALIESLLCQHPVDESAPIVMVQAPLGRPRGEHKFIKGDDQPEFGRENYTNVTIPERMEPVEYGIIEIALKPYYEGYQVGGNEMTQTLNFLIGGVYMDASEAAGLQYLHGKPAQVTVKECQGKFIPACEVSRKLVSMMEKRTALTAFHLYILATYAKFNINYLEP